MKKCERRTYWWNDCDFRIVLLGVFMFLALCVLGIKLFREQIYRADAYREDISKQSVRRIRIPAKRGRIYSADLQTLADNRSQRDLYLYPEEMRQPGRLGNTLDYILRAADELAAVLQRSNELTRKKLLRHINISPGLPILLFSDLSEKEIAQVFEQASRFRGVGVEENVTRFYPHGSLAAHLIGFTRREDPGQAPDRTEFFYYVPDTVGRSGLEKAFDQIEGEHEPMERGLKGVPGSSLVQVDNLGFIKKTLEEDFVPLHGNNLLLNLEVRAQKIAEELLSDKKGSIVLLDAENGAVLAMASSPSFDLSRCVPILSADYYRSLLRDPAKPLVARATMGQYTPGSILKVLVALALLENGVSPDEVVDCDGGTDIAGERVRCAAWRYGGHGPVNLYKAIEKSCNDYFLEKGMSVGIQKINKVLESAGIGRAPKLEIGAGSGLLPSDAAKRKRFRAAWNKFDTALASMGQGVVLLSPLQAALYTAAIANGGTLYEPQLVHSVVDNQGRVLRSFQPRKAGMLAAKPEHIEMVRKGMFAVVNSSSGSGRLARHSAIQLHGKTGSAEVGGENNRKVNTFFVCFGSTPERTYAMAVLIEDGVSGGSSAAPVAAEFFSRYIY